MDGYALVGTMVGHLAWPAAALVLAGMFRGTIRDVLGRIETANSKFVKLTLRSRAILDKLYHAEGMADAFGLPAARAPVTKPVDPHDVKFKALVGFAARKADAAVADACEYMLEQTCNVLERATGSRPSRRDLIVTLSSHADGGLVTMTAALTSLSYDPISDKSVAIEKPDAVRYIALAERVTLAVDRAIRPAAAATPGAEAA